MDEKNTCNGNISLYTRIYVKIYKDKCFEIFRPDTYIVWAPMDY